MEPGDLDPDPLTVLAAWLALATEAGEPEPGAMTLSTAGADGRPSARNVLLRGLDHRGLVWHTNYGSRKGIQLAENPYAAVVLTWLTLRPRRQVLASGPVERIAAEESDAYFTSRDRGNQLAAWASDQSTEIPDRAWLEQRLALLDARFAPGEVPRPPHWGGYRLIPESVEFWMAGEYRLHDRVRYRRDLSGGAAGPWSVARLAP
jgi:pyridoxamine 5'-phosphate oxidase